jgi:hypothetical protein
MPMAKPVAHDRAARDRMHSNRTSWRLVPRVARLAPSRGPSVTGAQGQEHVGRQAVPMSAVPLYTRFVGSTVDSIAREHGEPMISVSVNGRTVHATDVIKERRARK